MRSVAGSIRYSASRPPRLAVTAISPEADVAGRFWNRWNDSNAALTPPRSTRRVRRSESRTGSLIIRSTEPSPTSNQQ